MQDDPLKGREDLKLGIAFKADLTRVGLTRRGNNHPIPKTLIRNRQQPTRRIDQVKKLCLRPLSADLTLNRVLRQRSPASNINHPTELFFLGVFLRILLCLLRTGANPSDLKTTETRHVRGGDIKTQNRRPLHRNGFDSFDLWKQCTQALFKVGWPFTVENQPEAAAALIGGGTHVFAPVKAQNERGEQLHFFSRNRDQATGGAQAFNKTFRTPRLSDLSSLCNFLFFFADQIRQADRAILCRKRPHDISTGRFGHGG